jgi:hypothetical protein
MFDFLPRNATGKLLTRRPGPMSLPGHVDAARDSGIRRRQRGQTVEDGGDISRSKSKDLAEVGTPV